MTRDGAVISHPVKFEYKVVPSPYSEMASQWLQLNGKCVALQHRIALSDFLFSCCQWCAVLDANSKLLKINIIF